MNTEINSMITVLKNMSEAIHTRDELQDILNTSSKEQYVYKTVESNNKKPVEKEILKVPTYIAPFVVGCVAVVLLIIAAVCLALCLTGKQAPWVCILFSILALLAAVIEIAAAASTTSMVKTYTQRNEENSNYNNTTYKTELREYNQKIKAAEEEYGELIRKVRDIKKAAEVELQANINLLNNELGLVYSDKYYQDIDKVISVLEEGRADSLKEAINRMLDDKQQEAMLALQKSQTEMLEEQGMRIESLNRTAAEAAIMSRIAANNETEIAKNTREILNKLNGR